VTRRAVRSVLRSAGLLAVVAPAAAPAPLGAQQDTVRLTLAAVLARVAAEHPLVRAGAAERAAARARAADLVRYPNPSLEVERTTLAQADNVALLQPLRWPWERAALARLGRAGVAAADAQARGERAALLFAAAVRFADGLRDARALELAAQAESLAARGLARALAARALGQAGDLTVLQAQVGLDAARRARRAAQADRTAAAGALALLLGERVDAPLLLAGDLDSLAPLPGLPAFDSALARAAAADPEAARLAAEADRGAETAAVARARRWPTLALGPAASFEGPSVVGVSLGLELPLWNFQGAAIRAGEAERDAARARLAARRRDLAARLLDATTALSRAADQLALLRSGDLARAARAESLAARALEHGGPSLTAWLAARQAYLDARAAELDLEWQAARARLELHHLFGTLGP
jgi:outer membrane protein TolC